MDLEKSAHNLAFLKIKELDLSAYNYLEICERYVNEYNLFLKNLKIATNEEHTKAHIKTHQELFHDFGDI